MLTERHKEIAGKIWEIANRLRGPYRPPQYRLVMLPMVVLRRLDCVLEPTKDAVLAEHARLLAAGTPENAIPRLLTRVVDKERQQPLYNTSPFTFQKLLGDSENIAPNLIAYINGFSDTARAIFDKFKFGDQIEKLDSSNRLYAIVQAMADPKVDLHPDRISNLEMGYLFEHLVMRFRASSFTGRICSMGSRQAQAKGATGSGQAPSSSPARLPSGPSNGASRKESKPAVSTGSGTPDRPSGLNPSAGSCPWPCLRAGSRHRCFSPARAGNMNARRRSRTPVLPPFFHDRFEGDAGVDACGPVINGMSRDPLGRINGAEEDSQARNIQLIKLDYCDGGIILPLSDSFTRVGSGLWRL